MKAIGQKQWIDRQYNSIDLCKFIMAFAVVAIHTLPFADVKNVVFRNIYDTFVGLAVPFFFLASGYLLAVKMDYPYGSEGDLHRIQKQLRGMLRLYLTWTVFYAPLAIYHFIATGTPVMRALFLYFRGFVFIGVQYNSWPLWYLLSTIYSLFVIWLALKMKRTPMILAVVSIAAFFLSIGITELVNYNGNLPTIMGAVQKLIKVSITNERILSGMVYIPIGMLLAHKQIPKQINWLVFVIGFVLNCYVHHAILSRFLLIITAVSFFGSVEAVRLKDRAVYAHLRNMSTSIYLTHMYIWTFYYKIVYGGKTYGLDSFLITACVAVAIAAAGVVVKKKFRRGFHVPKRIG